MSSNNKQFVKINNDDVSCDSFLLGKEAKVAGKSDLSFSSIMYCPLADSQTPQSEIHPKDAKRVRSKQFSIVVANLDSKVTKTGVSMPSVWDNATRSFTDVPFSPTAKKHEMTLSLRASNPSQAKLIENLVEVSTVLRRDFASRHGLPENMVNTTPNFRRFEPDNGEEIHLFKLDVKPNSAFRFGGEVGSVSTFGAAGPFFGNGNAIKMLSIVPSFVMIRHIVSPDDETIFTYSLRVQWAVHFADVGAPPLRDDGKTYEESSKDYVKNLEADQLTAVQDLASACETIEMNAQMGAAVADLTPPATPQKKRARAVAEEAPAVEAAHRLSKLAESSELPAKKKVRRREKNPQPGQAGASHDSSSSSKSPPSLDHLLD